MNAEEKKGCSPAMWMLLAVVLLLIAIILPGMIPRGHNGGQREVVSNARQIGLALFEFETEYGRFPDAETAAKLREKSKKPLELGSASANDYFRQLIAAEIVDSERMFYAKTTYTKKPRHERDSGTMPLGPGVVGFGYLMNGKASFSTEGNPARVIACTPLAFDGRTVNSRNFDDDIHGGKAVVLRIDNSVTSLPILKKSGLVALGKGKTLLETGPGSVWGESGTPVIVPPLPKR